MYINIYVCAHIYMRDFHILLNLRSSLSFSFNITTGILLEVSFFFLHSGVTSIHWHQTAATGGKTLVQKKWQICHQLGAYQIPIFFPNLLASICFLESSNGYLSSFTAVCVCLLSHFSRVRLFVTPWTVA